METKQLERKAKKFNAKLKKRLEMYESEMDLPAKEDKPDYIS
jgi:hypothetical protein